MLGAFVALVSAALFGLNNAATRRAVLNGSVIQGMAITVPMGVVLFFVACLLTGSLGALSTFSVKAHLCFAAAGFSHFVFGRYCNYRAIAAIGTNLASPIQQWEVIVTLGLALLLLGEQLTPITVIAIALLLMGPGIAARMEGRARVARSVGAGAVETPAVEAEVAAAGKFQPRYREGYTWAFLSIFGYGASPIFIRAGLENAGVGASFAAGLVSYIAATVIVAIWIVAARQTAHVLELEASPRRWFVFAGVLVFLSQMARYMALALLPASIVAPIMRVQTLFRIYFSWILTRDHESFDRHVIVGSLVSLAGAVLISVPPEVVVAWLPMPDALRAALLWRWP